MKHDGHFYSISLFWRCCLLLSLSARVFLCCSFCLLLFFYCMVFLSAGDVFLYWCVCLLVFFLTGVFLYWCFVCWCFSLSVSNYIYMDLDLSPLNVQKRLRILTILICKRAFRHGGAQILFIALPTDLYLSTFDQPEHKTIASTQLFARSIIVTNYLLQLFMVRHLASKLPSIIFANNSAGFKLISTSMILP